MINAISIALLGSMLLSGSAMASPQLMRLQGRFTDSRQTPLTDTLPVRFTVFDTQYGNGQALWQETQTVAVRNSAFQVVLGRINPLPATVFDTSDRWLEMQIGENPPMRPRHRIPAGYTGEPIPQNTANPLNASGVEMVPEGDQRALERQIDQYREPVKPVVVPPPAPVVKPVPPAPKPVVATKQLPNVRMAISAEGVELGPVYEVQPGDTLKSVARKLFGNSERWYDLYYANQDRIGPGGFIAPGQLLVIPNKAALEKMKR